MSNPPLIQRLVTGEYKVNTYIIACPQSRQGAIIDPGGNQEEILACLEEHSIRPKYILNTHGHADHIMANAKLKDKLGVEIVLHEEDDAFFTDRDNLQAEQKELGLSIPGKADIRVRDGDILNVGALSIKVIHTPGHTPGSVCYLVAGNLFTGDTLFVGDVGRSDLTGGSFATLLQSIKEKIIVLPPETRIWPGHDYGEMPSSTLAWELKENPYITDFILGEE